MYDRRIIQFKVDAINPREEKRLFLRLSRQEGRFLSILLGKNPSPDTILSFERAIEKRCKNESIRSKHIEIFRKCVKKGGFNSFISASKSIKNWAPLMEKNAKRCMSSSKNSRKPKAKIIHEDIQKIRHHISIHSLPMVRNKASKFAKSGASYTDLFQEGWIGLYRATGKFNPKKDFRFMTYAEYWVVNAMQRFIDIDRTVKSPHGLVERSRKIKAAEGYITSSEGEHESTNLEKLAKKTGFSVSQVERIRNLTGTKILSFDKEPSDSENNGGYSLRNTIHDDQDPVDDLYADLEFHNNIRRMISVALQGLTDREKYIIFERFGFSTDVEKTFADMGITLGCSRERVRQIFTQCLDKMEFMMRNEAKTLELVK